jgi:hypothetical protein
MNQIRNMPSQTTQMVLNRKGIPETELETSGSKSKQTMSFLIIFINWIGAN